MSCVGVVEVFDKVPRLFVKIHRWAFIKMSKSCKLSGLKGGNFHSKKQKEGVHAHKSGRKWKRRVLFLCLWLLVFVSIVMCIWVLLGFYDGSFRSKQESLDSCEGRAQALLQYFNVSSDQLHDLASIFSKSEQITSLECSKERINKLASADGIDCVLRVLCSKENEFQQKGRWHGQQVKHIQQKPAEDEKLSRKLKRLLLDDFLPFVAHSLLSLHDCRKCISKRTGHSVGYLLKVFPSGFAEDYLWIFLGVLLACIIFLFYMNLRKKQKQKISKVEPVLQQQQQLLQMKQQNLPLTPPKSAGKWRRIILNVFLIFGVLTSAWLYWYLRQNLTLRREEALTNMCDERARMLQDQFNVSMNHVHALALLVSTFHHGKTPSAVDQKTFGEYTERTSFERPLTSGVAYALRVPHSEREQFEKHHRWTIKKMEKEDQTLVQDCDPEKLDPAPLQDEYAPVIFSQETVSHILSIDMMSGKEDRENILRARATGKGVLTSPFKLLKSNHVGVVLTFAVYNTDLPPNATPEQRIEATVGYIGASYDVPSLVEKLLHQLAGKETIVVNVYDTTNTSSPILMYGTNIIGDADPDLLHISYLDFGDPLRKHEMHCRYKHKAPIPWTAINASAGVLVIIILVFHIFHAAISRIAKVEKDFREMMELKVRAEAADVAKSQFLATVSHEIRTPMNGVLGMLQMLMDTDLNATQIDYAQTAHNSGKDLISLINEVLDQAKIESGRLELEAVPFEVRCILDNVLSLLSGKSSEKGIELAVYVSNQVPEVVIGDPGRFRQIITNLVGNSIKFTNERGHIFVTVHLADEVQILPEVKDPVLKQSLNFVSDEPNITYSSLSGLPVVDRWKSWEKFKNLNSTDMKDGTQIIRLLVTVEDTGVGIRADAQSHIFTPFMQADSSTSRTYGGTGIGLSISRCLVELMGGEIGFVSEPGISSTFSFTCAFRKGESSSLDTKWQPCDPAVLEFQGWRVLVIDKRSIRAEVTKYHLQRLGMSVDIASSMELVYADLSSGGPACVPADLAMVIVDKDAWNAEIAASLRNLLIKHKQNCGSRLSVDVPKFFLLASTTDECCKLISAGLVDNILTKPLRSSFLISSFLEALGCDKKSQLSRKKPATLGTLLRGKQLLVVDDNAVNRKVAEGALKKYGAIVTCVDSGKAAVKMLQPPHEIDACFMDLQMPEMDGYEATKQIRSLESEFNELIASGKVTVEKYGNIAHWYTPILAMTADVSKPTNEKCIKSGMDDYVSKPFEEEKLYNAVARFFESG